MSHANSRSRHCRVLFALTWLCLAVAPGIASAASIVDPFLRFRRLHTEHFVIYFHQGEREAAGRLAHIAERTWSDLRERFGWPLPARTHVILADQTDTANGWATPLPYNTIFISAAWPSGAEFIGQTDDWLRVVFAHEFTHIAHLDQSRGWARAARTVFGRVPLAFPNLFLPGWQIEGLATHFETAVTGGGRRFAGDFRAIERESARAHRGMPLDRVNGGLIAWPGGTSVYAYGLGFHDYLVGRFGVDRLVSLARATAGKVPYTGSRAFAPVFGQPLGVLWADYQAATREAVKERAAPASTARQLTFEAYDIAAGRFLPPRCDGCPLEIAYSVRNPREFPALKVIAAEGGPARTLTTRYLGGAIGVGVRRLVFDQLQLHRNISLFSDLYAVSRDNGEVTALTSGARLQDPDISADGRQVVATRQHRGARDLVVATIADDGSIGPFTVIAREPDTQFATPRWSPDGRHIAVERHRRGEGAQVVIVNRATRTIRVAARGATRAVTPAWRPDGGALVVAADEPDRPFNLFEVAIDSDGSPGSRRRLTATTGGARNPDISPDGKTLLFVGYTADGFDLFSLPYPEDAALAPESPLFASPTVLAPSPATITDPPAGGDSPYRPWHTLRPRAWLPLVSADNDQVLFGVSTGGADVLGYHGYTAAAQWRAFTPAGAPAADHGRPDWSAAYVYDRWVPQLYTRVTRATSFLTGASAPAGVLSTLRETRVEAGIQLPLRRVLRSQRLLLTAMSERDAIVDDRRERAYDRVAVRAGWIYRSARFYGYSISPEHGIAAGAGAEFSGARVSGLGDAVTVTGDLRGYLPGAGRQHVLALRAAAGASSGPRDLGRTFRLGGAASNPEPLDFGRGAMSLLRGFAANAGAGRRIAVMNGDYRWPVARVERGYGTVPLFLRQLHAGTFVDAGAVWNNGGLRLGDVKWAAGIELSADLIVGYSLPLTLTAGVARGRDGAGRLPDSTVAFMRVGRAF